MMPHNPAPVRRGITGHPHSTTNSQETTIARHNGPMTDEHMRALRHRNWLRVRHATEQLGDRWLLHPTNSPARVQYFDPAAGLGAFAEVCKNISSQPWRAI